MSRNNRLIVLLLLITVIAALLIVGVYLWQNLVFRGESQALSGTPHTLIKQMQSLFTVEELRYV